MPEYIDREALIAEINEEIEYRTPMYTDEQNDYIEKGLRIARKDIKRFSATDVVEVVRCKDCKFWDAVRNTKYKGTGICKPPNLSLKGGYCVRRGATLENDYCSGAKRKDGDAK